MSPVCRRLSVLIVVSNEKHAKQKQSSHKGFSVHQVANDLMKLRKAKKYYVDKADKNKNLFTKFGKSLIYLVYCCMAKQVGDHKITGTYDNLCFYKMEGEHYIRKKSCLTGKAFWRRKCFEGSRQSCDRFGKGNHYASIVYKEFRKQKGMWTALKSKAIALFKAEKNPEEVIKKLVSLALLLQPQKSLRVEDLRSKRERLKVLPQLFTVLPLKKEWKKKRVLLETG